MAEETKAPEQSAPASPGAEAAKPVEQAQPTPAAPVTPPPTGEPPKPEPPKPTEPPEVEPAKPEVKPEIVSRAEQIKLPEKLGEVEAEFLKTKLEQFTKTAIESKMPLAEAQKAIENQVQLFRDVAAFGDARLKAQQETWISQIKTDKDLGGDKFNRTSQLSERALTTLFGKDFYEKELKNLYLINHPEIVKGLVRFAEKAGDAFLPPLGDKPAAPEKPLTLGEKVYGKGYDPMNVGNASGKPKIQ